MPELRIMPLHEVSLRDIAGRLRRLADQIEQGDYEGIRAAVVVLDARGMPILALNDAPPPVASEVLDCAHYKMIQGRLIGADALEL